MDDRTAKQLLDDASTRVMRLAPKWLDREQIAMDIWLELWQKDETHVTDTLVNSRVRDALRSTSFETQMGDNFGELPHSSEAATYGSSHDSTSCLIGLTKEEHEVIWRRFYDDETYEEIRAALGLSRSRVRRVLREALDKLRKHND